jgi:hypothetical protein
MTGVERTYDCDSCGRTTPRSLIRLGWAYGTETYACVTCWGQGPEDLDEVELETYNRWKGSTQ